MSPLPLHRSHLNGISKMEAERLEVNTRFVGEVDSAVLAFVSETVIGEAALFLVSTVEGKKRGLPLNLLSLLLS